MKPQFTSRVLAKLGQRLKFKSLTILWSFFYTRRGVDAEDGFEHIPQFFDGILAEKPHQRANRGQRPGIQLRRSLGIGAAQRQKDYPAPHHKVENQFYPS
jgi:hypothetical protein